MINEDTSKELPDITQIDATGLGACDKCGGVAEEVVRIETFRGSTLFTICSGCLTGFRKSVWNYLKPNG